MDVKRASTSALTIRIYYIIEGIITGQTVIQGVFKMTVIGAIAAATFLQSILLAAD